MWSLIVGLLILLILIAAVIVLLVTTLSADRDTKANDAQQTVDENYEQGDGVTELNDPDDPTLPDDPDDTAPDTTDPEQGGNEGSGEGSQVTQAVTSVVMKCFGAELSKSSEDGADYDISMKLREKLDIAYATNPVVENADVTWTSADENVAMVLQSGQVTAVGKGTTTVTLTVNGTSAVCIIRVS